MVNWEGYERKSSWPILRYYTTVPEFFWRDLTDTWETCQDSWTLG